MCSSAPLLPQPERPARVLSALPWHGRPARGLSAVSSWHGRPARVLSLALALLLAGCASSGGSGSATGAAGERGGPAERPLRLPGALGARWAAPDFATRVLEGERAAVIDAAVIAANSLGYAVNRIDGASGKVSAARRLASAFDGATQDTLEVNVTTLAPGSTRVSVKLRETVESASAGDERGGGFVTTALVRDRTPYDAFFNRLAESLAPAPGP